MSYPRAAIFFVLSAFAPLSLYAISIATFGVAHVLYEMRYMDQRFSKTLTNRRLFIFLATVAGVAIFRAAGLLEVPGAFDVEGVFRFLVYLAAAFTAIFYTPFAIPILAAIALGTAGSVWPALVAMIFVYLHNLTPWIFLLENTKSQEERSQVNLKCFVVFVSLPLVLASGWPSHLAALITPQFLSETYWLDRATIGMFTSHYMGSANWEDWVTRGLFASAVYLQNMHYDAVIRVLPALPGQDRGKIAWPRETIFRAGIMTFTAMVLVFYFMDFSKMRSWYGVLSMVHVSLEWPLIFVGLHWLTHRTEAKIKATLRMPKLLRRGRAL